MGAIPPTCGNRLCLAYDGYKFGTAMTNRNQNHWRSFLAVLCFFTTVLLYAPLAGAAWSLYSTACCTSSQCPIKGHHAQHSPVAPEHAMDCGHDRAAMASCTMSCCHNPDRPALNPIIFVLPAPVTVSAGASFEPFVALFQPPKCSAAPEPLSPPPRFAAAAA